MEAGEVVTAGDATGPRPSRLDDYPALMSSARSPMLRLLRALSAVPIGLVATVVAIAFFKWLGAGESTARAAAVVVGGGVIALVACVVLGKGPAHLRRVASDRRPPLRAIIVGVGAGVLGLIIAGLILLVGRAVDPSAKRALDRLGDQDIGIQVWWQAVLIGVAVVVIAPFGEEILFRGVILRSLTARFTWWPATIVSALVFAGSHLDAYLAWPRALALVALGILLAVVYRRQGLIGSMTMHATVNTAALIALLLR